jgi:hypothetical protein
VPKKYKIKVNEIGQVIYAKRYNDNGTTTDGTITDGDLQPNQEPNKPKAGERYDDTEKLPNGYSVCICLGEGSCPVGAPGACKWLWGRLV